MVFVQKGNGTLTLTIDYETNLVKNTWTYEHNSNLRRVIPFQG